MRHILTILAALFLCAAPAQAQTLKALSYNTTNGLVVANTTNLLIVTNRIWFQSHGTNQTIFNSILITDESSIIFDGVGYTANFPTINFAGATESAQTRTNLGLGATNDVVFQNLQLGTELLLNGNTGTISWNTNNYIILEEGRIGAGVPSLTNDVLVWGPTEVVFLRGISFTNDSAGITRTNLGLGATNNVTFAGLTNNGDIRINQTATNNGLLYIYRTNAEPFLGLANLIASNNTTISNESLFRVGVAEATNKAAQFGFRSTNTNGNGVAVFSVFGYNALMMIGPSDPNAGTNPIQATVYSIAPTNKVMTLITTNTGAMQMHRPIGIDTAGVSTNAPANTTNVAGWIQFYVGTNSVRVPYYQ